MARALRGLAFGRIGLFTRFGLPAVAGVRTMPLPNANGSSNSRKKTMGTFDSQASLPKLPVAPLKESIATFLESVKPLLTAEELAHTQELAKDFVRPGGEGERLHAALVGKREREGNWLEAWWLERAYMIWRCPTLINISPGVTWDPNDNRPVTPGGTEKKQLRTAAEFIERTVMAMHEVGTNRFRPDIEGGRPMCMDGYTKLFAGCRIPKKGCDDFVYTPLQEVREILVACKGHFFAVPVFDSEQRVLPLKEIEARLKSVMDAAEKLPPSARVGLLPTEDRDKWAAVRERMLADPVNAATLKRIEETAFCVSLEDIAPVSRSQLQCQVLHGLSSDVATPNRWSDKTFHIIVCPNGMTGTQMEHAGYDAMPLVSMFNDVWEGLVDLSGPRAEPSAVPPTQLLEWTVNDELQADIAAAAKAADACIANLDLHVGKLESAGKNQIKAKKLAPDATFQMALQLAYRRIHGKPCGTYETAHTRAFLHGRTETIRSCVPTSAAFVDAMIARDRGGADAPPVEKVRELLSTAVRAHTAYTKRCMQGMGVDRLLFGLKQVAVDAGEPVPALLEDSAYTRSVHFNLSTSQVPGPIMGCYGPVAEDGYGVCYNIANDSTGIAISSMRSNAETDSLRLARELEKALMQIIQLDTTPGPARL